MLELLFGSLYRRIFGIIKDCKDCGWCDGDKCKKFAKIVNIDTAFENREDFIFDHHPYTKMREQDCGKWAEYFRKK